MNNSMHYHDYIITQHFLASLLPRIKFCKLLLIFYPTSRDLNSEKHDTFLTQHVLSL